MRNSNLHSSNGFKILHAFLVVSLILLIPAANARASSYQEKSYYTKAGTQVSFSHSVAYLDLMNLLEYTFDVNGTQIFPNETIKQQIVSPDNNNTAHVYNLTRLQYSMAGFDINASGVTIHVNSTKIDSNHTRLDLDIYADKATVKGKDNNLQQQYDRSFDKVTLRSLYGIYNKTTDKMTVHIPYLALLPFLD